MDWSKWEIQQKKRKVQEKKDKLIVVLMLLGMIALMLWASVALCNSGTPCNAIYCKIGY